MDQWNDAWKFYEGRKVRPIRLDRAAYEQGILIPVDAETGDMLGEVRDVALDCPLDGVVTITVEFNFLGLYPAKDEK